MIRARTWGDRNGTPLKYGRALRQGAENSLSPITAPPRAVVFFQTPPEPANLPAVERVRRHSSAAIDRPRRRQGRHPVAARLLRRTAPPAVAAALILGIVISVRQAVLATRAGRADDAARAEAQRRQQPPEALPTERVTAGPMAPTEARRPIRFCRIAAPTGSLPGLTVPARETSLLSG